MKTTKTFENASLVSVINGSITIKSAAGIEHTFTNASVVSINNGTIIIESEWKPEKGELVKISTTDSGIRYAIFKEILGYKFWMYCSSFDKLTCLPLDYNLHKWYSMCSISNISPVTLEEQKEFDDFCKSQGKIWNKEKLQWENYKWSPKPNECYWYVATWGEVMYRHYIATSVDQGLLQLGNAFPTKEQAQKVAEKVKELFKSL